MFGLLYLLMLSIACVPFAWGYGRRPYITRTRIVLRAFLITGIFCWSLVGGGGHPPGILPLPSWIVFLLFLIAALSGSLSGTNSVVPSVWLNPWMPFIAYLIAAEMSRRSSSNLGQLTSDR